MNYFNKKDLKICTLNINSTIKDEKGNGIVKQVSKEIIRYDEKYHLYKTPTEDGEYP